MFQVAQTNKNIDGVIERWDAEDDLAVSDWLEGFSERTL